MKAPFSLSNSTSLIPAPASSQARAFLIPLDYLLVFAELVRFSTFSSQMAHCSSTLKLKNIFCGLAWKCNYHLLTIFFSYGKMHITFQTIDFRVNFEISAYVQVGRCLYVNIWSGDKGLDKPSPEFQRWLNGK